MTATSETTTEPAPTTASADVLPQRPAPEVAVALLTAIYVALLGPAAGLVWAAAAPKLSIPALVANSDAVFHAQIGADAWFLLVGGIAGGLSALIAWLVVRDETPGLAIGLAVGGIVAALIADRVGYLHERGATTRALEAIGAHPTGSAISEIDFRIRALGVLTVWALAALVVLGIIMALRSARR